MMRKFFFLAVTLVILHTTTQAQQLMHSFGATVSAIFGKVETDYSSYTFAMRQTSFCYFPRLNFIENENSSVSIGFPVAAGFGIATNTDASGAGLYFSYDLPAVLDYNIGAKSTSDNEDSFGGYFGLGFGYYKVGIKNDYSSYNGATYGPIIRGGVRLASASDAWNGHGLTIGLFYKKGIEKQKLNTVGFNILYDL